MPLIGVSSSHGMSARLKPVVAGGTLSSDETYYYRAFTTNDTFSVSGGNISGDYMLVAGGGAGGDASYNVDYFQTTHGGGGGAGGLLSGTGTTLTTGDYPIVIGAGGAIDAFTGSNSTFNGVTANGGGRGGFQDAKNGGSGGGGHARLWQMRPDRQRRDHMPITRRLRHEV